MKPESRRPAGSYAPNLPKPALFGLAALADLVLPGAWAYSIFRRGEASFVQPSPWLDIIINEDPIKNIAIILALFQLNYEAIYMFLTKRRNQHEKEEAVTQAEARATAQATSQANAKARAWYEANKDQLPADLPQPPFLEDTQNNA